MVDKKQNQEFQEEPPFSEEEKKLYQGAYKKMQESIDVSFYNPDQSFREIVGKIAKENVKRNRRSNWLVNLSQRLSIKFGVGVATQASTAAISVFAIGILFGMIVNTGPNYSNNPRTSIDALRSGESDQWKNAAVITVANPLDFINLVLNSGVEAGLKIEVQKIKDSYLVKVDGLKSGDSSQIGFKALIGLTDKQDGSIVLRINSKK